MIYVAACIWLLIAVLMAWGVYHLWGGMVKPKTLDIVLFPGTFVVQIGRIVALLVTGAKFNPKALAPPDKKDPKPFDGPTYEPSIPVFGPLLTALIPLVFTLGALYCVLTRFGQPVWNAVPAEELPVEVPGTISIFWSQLRGLITLAERTLEALRDPELVNWRAGVLTYLLVSLSVRLSPFRGNAAGLFGSIFILTAVAALIGTLTDYLAQLIQLGWPLICVTLGMLVLLMIGTLLARGLYTTMRMLAQLQ